MPEEITTAPVFKVEFSGRAAEQIDQLRARLQGAPVSIVLARALYLFDYLLQRESNGIKVQLQSPAGEPLGPPVEIAKFSA